MSRRDAPRPRRTDCWQPHRWRRPRGTAEREHHLVPTSRSGKTTAGATIPNMLACRREDRSRWWCSRSRNRPRDRRGASHPEAVRRIGIVGKRWAERVVLEAPVGKDRQRSASIRIERGFRRTGPATSAVGVHAGRERRRGQAASRTIGVVSPAMPQVSAGGSASAAASGLAAGSPPGSAVLRRMGSWSNRRARGALPYRTVKNWWLWKVAGGRFRTGSPTGRNL